jgi:amino acid transporter
MIGVNAGVALPVSMSLAVGVFFAMAAFPGANLIIGLLIALALLPPVWILFSLMAATMPRTGGDYIYGSRILHPVLGLWSNILMFLGTLLGVGISSVYVIKLGLTPLFATIDAVTGNHWWATASATIAENGWTFAIAAVAIIVVSLLSVLGTKFITRFVMYLYFASLIVALASIVILLFTSHHHFISSVNKFAGPLLHKPDVYSSTVAAGAKAGIAYPARVGYSFKNTLGASLVMLGVASGTYYGIYLAGEFKGAGRRRRQIGSMLGTGLFQGIVLLLGMIIFIHTAGYDFTASASNGKFSVGSPFYSFFASIIVGGSFFPILLAVLFAFALPPLLYGNMAMTQRVPFALAFDGLIPQRAATVSNKTHAPTASIIITAIGGVAMAAWAAFSPSFITILAYANFVAPPPFIVVGLAGIWMYYRRRDLYEGGPADWKVAGIPVLPVCGAITVFVGVYMLVLMYVFNVNVAMNPVWLTVVIVGGFVLAAGLYYGARAAQRARGVDLDLVYKSLPAE